jgi:ADP-heptose:LPS heptosyltransferase
MDLRNIKNNIENILVIRRNNVGDMICAIPVFRTLRKEFPHAHITVFADSTNAGVVKGASFIDKLIVYKKRHGLFRNKYISYWKTFRENKTKYDIAIVLKVGFSSTSALITLISGARIRMGCIPEKWHPLQLCYNLPLKVHESWKLLHIKDAFLEMIKIIGIEAPVKDITIEIASESRERVNRFFKENNIQEADNIIVFNISNNRPENTWPIERFKETAYLISKQYNAIYIITSVPSDKDKAVMLSKEIGNAFYFVEITRVIDFAALVAESDLLICGEGGAMHIGASVHTPTISLWGKSASAVAHWMHNDEKQFMIKKGEHVNNIPADDIFNILRKNNLLAMNERT